MMIYNYKERGLPKLPLITLILLFLVINLANSEVTWTEDDPDLRIIQGVSFNDGSICLRLAKDAYENCYEPTLHLRIIRPNEEVIPLNINDISPAKNFCKGNALIGTPFHKHKHDDHHDCDNDIIQKRWDCGDDGGNDGGNEPGGSDGNDGNDGNGPGG